MDSSTWKKCLFAKRLTRLTVGISKLRNNIRLRCGRGNRKPGVPVKVKNLIVISMN